MREQNRNATPRWEHCVSRGQGCLKVAGVGSCPPVKCPSSSCWVQFLALVGQYGPPLPEQVPPEQDSRDSAGSARWGPWPVTPEPTAPPMPGAVGCECSESLLQPTVRRRSRRPGGSSGARMVRVRQQGLEPPRASHHKPGSVDITDSLVGAEEDWRSDAGDRGFSNANRWPHHPTVQNLNAAEARSCLVSWSIVRRPATQEKGRGTGDQGWHDWHQPRRRPLCA